MRQIPRYDKSYDMNSVKLLIKFYMQLYDVKEFNKDQIERMVEQSEFLKSLPVMVGFKKTTQDMWLIYNKDQRFENQITLDAFFWVAGERFFIVALQDIWL